jgi:hypothetical protein
MFMDLALARRVERMEGSIGRSFTAVRQQLTPEVGAVFREFAGTYAIFDGAESPMTQTFGLGLFEPATPDLLATIEAFFSERGAEPMHEVSPLAGVDTIALLAQRGYRPMDLSTVLVQPIVEQAAANANDLRVRMIEPADRETWVETSVSGWSEDPMYGHVIRALTEIAVANTAMTHFLVERAGAPIATGSLCMHEGMALLAGASTIPAGRGLGAQGLLLAARMTEARARGCEVALMVASPGSTSQRNAERRGFRVAYTRTKWRLARAS